jgi:hypothetical protein
MSGLWYVLVLDPGEDTPLDDKGQPVHWKPIRPRLNRQTAILLAEPELDPPAAERPATVQDFFLLAVHTDGQRLFQLVLRDDAIVDKLKDWYRDNRDKLGLRLWAGRSSKEMWLRVVKDRDTDPVARAIIRRMLKYPATIYDAESAEFVERMVSLGDATTLHGVTPDYDRMMDLGDRVIPFKIFGEK